MVSTEGDRIWDCEFPLNENSINMGSGRYSQVLSFRVSRYVVSWKLYIKADAI